MRRSSIRQRATAPKASRNRSDNATPMSPIRWVLSRIEEVACSAQLHNIDFDAGRVEHANKCQPSSKTNRFSTDFGADSARRLPLIRFLPLNPTGRVQKREEESRIFASLACHSTVVAMRIGSGV